jgi:hypothetical protein
MSCAKAIRQAAIYKLLLYVRAYYFTQMRIGGQVLITRLVE